MTGGISSRFFYRNKFYALPLLQGKESTGANALALSGNGKMAVIVGGDFAVDTFSTLNCVVVQLKTTIYFGRCYPTTWLSQLCGIYLQ